MTYPLWLGQSSSRPSGTTPTEASRVEMHWERLVWGSWPQNGVGTGNLLGANHLEQSGSEWGQVWLTRGTEPFCTDSSSLPSAPCAPLHCHGLVWERPASGQGTQGDPCSVWSFRQTSTALDAWLWSWTTYLAESFTSSADWELSRPGQCKSHTR